MCMLFFIQRREHASHFRILAEIVIKMSSCGVGFGMEDGFQGSVAIDGYMIWAVTYKFA